MCGNVHACSAVAAAYGTSSLNKCCLLYGKRLGTAYVLHPDQLAVKDGRVCLPLYMAMCL